MRCRAISAFAIHREAGAGRLYLWSALPVGIAEKTLAPQIRSMYVIIQLYDANLLKLLSIKSFFTRSWELGPGEIWINGDSDGAASAYQATPVPVLQRDFLW